MLINYFTDTKVGAYCSQRILFLISSARITCFCAVEPLQHAHWKSVPTSKRTRTPLFLMIALQQFCFSTKITSNFIICSYMYILSDTAKRILKKDPEMPGECDLCRGARCPDTFARYCIMVMIVPCWPTWYTKYT